MRLFYTLWPISQTLSAKSEGRGIPKTLSAESDILHTPSETFQTVSGKSRVVQKASAISATPSKLKASFIQDNPLKKDAFYRESADRSGSELEANGTESICFFSIAS
jgi:hypothetical protein